MTTKQLLETALLVCTAMLVTPAVGQVQTDFAKPIETGFGKELSLRGDFDGNGITDVMFYHADSRDWNWRTQENGRLQRFLVGNTAGFGNLADGRPIWSGDFDGNGRADVLFYFSGDRNWWMGSLEGRVLQWRLVGNTAGFGNAYDGRPFFTGSFSRTDRAQVLFYFPGDHNWWLGTVNGGSLQWSLTGNTYGFGALTRGHKFYVGDFNGDRLTDVMFHYPTDGNWWLGSLAGDRLHWFPASNTKGFGNVSDGRPIWTADFNGDSRADILFYTPGDRNWWLGASGGFTLNWSLVDNTADFGNLADGRPFFQGRFARSDREEVMFFHPADHNWWKASLEGSRLSWALVGNTSGFGSGYSANIGLAVLRGAFRGGLSELLFFSAFDRHAWLGAFRGNTLDWGLVDAPAPIAPTSLSLTKIAESSVSLR